MENSKLRRASFLEILFDGRNQAYGAYLLRLHYEHRLRLALVMVMAAVLVFCTIILLLPRNKAIVKPLMQVPPVRIEPLQPPQKKEKELPVYKQPSPAPASRQAMKKLTIPDITPDKEVQKVELPPKQMDKVRVGPVTQSGLTTTGALAVPAEMKGVGRGSGNGVAPGGHKASDYEG